jgi:hypothetical protein
LFAATVANGAGGVKLPGVIHWRPVAIVDGLA